jgi:hypothetical protein
MALSKPYLEMLGNTIFDYGPSPKGEMVEPVLRVGDECRRPRAFRVRSRSASGHLLEPEHTALGDVEPRWLHRELC